jgi:5-methylcytosine-specific restriction endonuclease McrA
MTNEEKAACEAGKNKRNRTKQSIADSLILLKVDKVTKAQLSKRFNQFDGLCAYCGQSLGQKTELDHIIPTAKGGLSVIENLVYACSSCNQSKSSRDLIPWLRSRSIYTVDIELKLLSVFPYLPLLFPNYYE